MPTRRSTRSNTRSKLDKEKQELDRKLRELSHSKRHTLKRTFSHMRKRVSDKKHQQQKIKQLKKKYGKFYNTYKQLEPRLTANLANKVIMIAKDYDKQQNKYKRDLKQLNKQKTKITKEKDKLQKRYNDLEFNLGIQDWHWRQQNISPNVLRNLTQQDINNEVRDTNALIRHTNNNLDKKDKMLKQIDLDIKSLTSKIDS
tara:strand:+ start:1385 stop:1984 length:600 start_codon:yes stop_codon:yes gene_type:complete